MNTTLKCPYVIRKINAKNRVKYLKKATCENFRECKERS